MKYLIIKCEELGDQWECDADRTPILITDDKSKYGRGYEVWQINDDGTLTKIKEYETPLEKGMALYYWEDGEDEEGIDPQILEKYKDSRRDSFSKSFFKTLKNRVGFSSSVKDIMTDVQCSGAHGELIKNKWTVFGEYSDNVFKTGYQEALEDC